METAAAPVSDGQYPLQGRRHVVQGCRRAGRSPASGRSSACTAGPEELTTTWNRSAASLRGRRVIFYDQLGCGRSPYPEDPSMWTVELFVEELGAVRDALGLDHIHLFGSSWGGMLAMEYALTQPSGLESLVIASSPASMTQWVEEAERLRAELPQEVQDNLTRHEEAGTTDDPAYKEACMASTSVTSAGSCHSPTTSSARSTRCPIRST